MQEFSKGNGMAPTVSEQNELANLFSKGDFLGLEVQTQRLLKRYPRSGFLWKVLGMALSSQGKDSLVALQKAVELLPDDPEVRNSLGSLLKELGRLEESETAYRQALQLDPGFPIAHYNLGTLFQSQGSLQKAEESYRRAVLLKPDFPEAFFNLATVLEDSGRKEEAEACYRKTLSIRKEHPEACYNLAMILLDKNCLVEAEVLNRQAIQVRPEFADAHNNLGRTLMAQNRLVESEACFRKAVEIFHNHSEAWVNLGQVLEKLGNSDEAEKCYLRGLEIRPDFVEAFNGLSDSLRKQGRLDEAEAACRRALEIRPDYLLAHVNMSIMLMDQGRLEEAEAACRRALDIDPDCANALGNLLFLKNYTSFDTAESWVGLARQYGQLVSKLALAPYSSWVCASKPQCLRVGVVSGDFRDHSVGHFLESLIAEIDRSRVELIAYPTDLQVTDLTVRIVPSFAAWKPLVGLDDQAAARMIHGDGVHVLLDLSGFTNHNRLPIFAWKPAPVQASWLGYCATTGVAEIDYYMADANTLPPEQEKYFTEKVWRLPETYICFSTPQADIAVVDLPASRTGYVTFGSFNNLTKVTDKVVEVWARILQAVPGSKLFVKALQLKDDGVRTRLLEQFLAFGVEADRLLLEGPIFERGGHLDAYNRVDIGLDPFPYNGVTTTAEALWMGVPVLTLAGERFLSRQGVGILTNVGLEEWIAKDIDELVEKAAAHAADIAGLRLLRTTLRARLQKSPLLNAPRFARNFENALWGMWQKCSTGVTIGVSETAGIDQRFSLHETQVKALSALFVRGDFVVLDKWISLLLKQNPDSGAVWKILGAALDAKGKDSLAVWQRAAELLPEDFEVEANLGNALYRQRRLEEACQRYLRALQIKPTFSLAYRNLSLALKGLGRLDESAVCCLHALDIDSKDADAWSNLGVVRKAQGRFSEAEEAYLQALKVAPDYAGGYFNLGILLQETGRGEEARQCYLRALAVNPEYAEALCNLSMVQRDVGQLLDAELSCRKAIQFKGDYFGAYNNLGVVLREMGRLEDAEVSYRRALEINPFFLDAYSNMLFAYNYGSLHTPEFCFDEARRYGELVATKVNLRYAEWNCEKAPQRLRVGLVSGDFCDHSVGYFLEGVVKEIDSRQIELIAYPTHHQASELTLRIKPSFAAWKSLVGLDDESAARMIHADGVHVLLDLSGHSSFNRLPVFAWKPAPIQASWLGYCATTGVAEIDYYIADGETLPPDQERYFTEAVWRLPESYLCFSRPSADIEVSELPVIATGHVTFGSFNNLTKVTDEVVKLWARILQAVPDSRLFIKASQLSDPSMCGVMQERFSAWGIGADRLLLEGRISERGGHLAAYNRVDIGLDPFPYNGVTTTVEALWMGVPVLTLAGERFLSRQGGGILTNIGLANWVAKDEDDFVAKAVASAADIAGLKVLRSGLRERLMVSPVLNIPAFARNFESAMWAMWRKLG